MKKKNAGIIASLIALKSKVFGAGLIPLELPMPLYGPPRPSILEISLNIFRGGIVAPILFFIGIIIYLKKSKSSKKRKVITTIIFILLLVGMYFGIEVLLNMQYDVITS